MAMSLPEEYFKLISHSHVENLGKLSIRIDKVLPGGGGEAHIPEIMHCAAFSIRVGKNQGPGLQFRGQYNILHTLLNML